MRVRLSLASLPSATQSERKTDARSATCCCRTTPGADREESFHEKLNICRSNPLRLFGRIDCYQAGECGGHIGTRLGDKSFTFTQRRTDFDQLP